jgi:transmembrane sensor
MTRSSSQQLPYTELQRREAAEWFLVIHDKDDPKPETLQAWLRWVDQDEGNRVAFESVAQAWHSTPASSALGMPSAEELNADAYDADQPVEEWLARRTGDAAAAGVSQLSGVIRSIRINRRAWLAAASVAAISLGFFTMHRYSDWFGSQSDEFTTKVGEQLQITLADGSRVWLGPKSKVVVAFTQRLRNIQLASGEAYFTVRKDRFRPFTVRSVGGDITAVGTAFNVRAVDDRVTVAVSEGTVTVAPMTQAMVAQPAAVRVASGQQVTFTAGEPIKALTITQTPTLGERARWRDGVLVYRDEPLRDVVMDVVRYSEKQIEIRDPGIGDLRYSGVVYKSAVDEWTDALPESFPVKIVSEDDRTIIRAR